MTRPSPPVPAHRTPSGAWRRLQICAGAVVNRLVSCGPAVTTPFRLTNTPSERPFKKSDEAAIVQNVGPEADVLTVEAARIRARGISRRRLGMFSKLA